VKAISLVMAAPQGLHHPEQHPVARVVAAGDEGTGKVETEGELELQHPLIPQGQPPAVLLHEPGFEAEAEELDQARCPTGRMRSSAAG
jgi:hypothetical protein